MDRLKQRLAQADSALRTLEELAFIESPSRIERDAATQRFEYTVEATWKAAQRTLALDYGVELASPKPVVRACAQNGLLEEAAAREAMQMIDDRNLTAHTYNEPLAIAIFSRLPPHLLSKSFVQTAGFIFLIMRVVVIEESLIANSE